LDGLQYANQCSLDLLLMIVTDVRNSGLLVVGTCDSDHDDEEEEKTVLSSLTLNSSSSSSSSYLSAKLLEIADGENVTIVNISLSNLDKGQVHELLVETLDLDNAVACDRLSTIVHDQTCGNQFYTYVYLCRLVDHGILFRNEMTGTWTWDDEWQHSLYSKMKTSSYSIQVFLEEQMRKYPVELMDVLKVASCFGSRIQKQPISLVLGYSVDRQLKKAEARGIIFYEKECHGYFFVHDLVQYAVDELTLEQDRELFHVEVGRRLWRKLGSQQLDRHIFLVLSQMHLGRRLISREKELVAIATLCLHAGNKAAASSSFRIACVYLTFGIDLLTGVSWRDQYDLLLALHNSAAEMLSYSANFERMDEVIDVVIRHARVYDDKIQVYSTRIWALGVTDRQQECAILGVEVLKQLGVHFPGCLCQTQAYFEWKKVRKLLQGKSDEQLLRLPPLQNERTAQILRILEFIGLHMAVAMPNFAPFVLLKSIRLTLENGISILAPLAFSNYAGLCVTFNRPDDAFHYAELALLMLKRMEAVEYLPRVYVMVYGFINSYKTDPRASLDPLLTAQCVGHQTGDVEYASVAASMYLVNAVGLGHSLQAVWKEALQYRTRMTASGQKSLLRMTDPHVEFVRRLTGAPGEALDFDKAIEEATQLGAVKSAYSVLIVEQR
jgi:predicted ATPase